MRCWGEFGPWQFLQLGQPWKRLPSSKELAIFWKNCWSFDSLGCFLLILWCRQRIHMNPFNLCRIIGMCRGFLSPLIWVVDQCRSCMPARPTARGSADKRLASVLLPRFGDTLKGIPCIGGLLGFLADFVET